MKKVVDQQMVTSSRAIIFSGRGDDLRVLLVRRRFPPYDGMLTLPGGFLKTNETSLDNIKRKVLKETGLNLDDSFSSYQLSSRSNNLDPRGFQITDNYLFVSEIEIDIDSLELEGEERPEWYFLDEIEALGFNHGAMLCEALGLMWEKLPKLGAHPRGGKVPYTYSEKTIDWGKPVVFFSGSFDPWHDGHQACLDLCPNKNILIVPDSNPWKVQDSKFEKRCFWKEYRDLAFKFDKSKYGVFPGYFGIEDGNPTVSWLPLVDCNKKEFLMGLDSFTSFPRWRDVTSLVTEISKIYVVPRLTQSGNETVDIVKQIKNLNEDIEVIFLEEHSYMEISSTELRKR